jgi:anti-anti-sigma regulatory factor
MKVRITKETDSEETIIRIAGRLRSEVIPELEKECQSVVGPLVLDLSELVSADKAGIEKLRELAGGRAELRGVSGYVQMLLDDQESTGWSINLPL